jgi:hypothetical protein
MQSPTMIWSSGSAGALAEILREPAVRSAADFALAEFFWTGSIVLIAITDSHATPETPD